MKIAIYTQDIELFDNIKLYVAKNCECLLFKDNEVRKNFDITIIDNFNKKFNLLINNIPKNKNIFYIGNDIQDEAINTVNTPFKLEILIERINNYITFYNNNIVKYGFGEFNFNRQIFTTDNKIIEFTEQENKFLQLITNKNGAKKPFIIKTIWNNYDSEKLLNNLVYNIRQKFKTISVDNFILCENNNFFIGKL